MPAMVTMTNVTKAYRRGKQRVEVLRGLNLSVNEGEFVAVMGPSGSGKSTMLNLIAGLDRPDEGEIVIKGKRIDKMSSGQLSKWRRDNVGLIFQFYNLLPMLKADRNVEIPLLLTKLSRRERERHVAAALELVGMSDRAKHRPTELSGGQQQRIAIARALVSDPQILLCDEPTGDLDRENSDSILVLLHQINREQGKTIIMVTHDPKAADYASRRVIVDKGGLYTASTRAAA